MKTQQTTISKAAEEARRYICDEYEMQIRPATAAEIAESDVAEEGWIEVADVDDMVYVDGDPLVGRDAHGQVAIWSARQNKMIDARYTSYRDIQIAISSIGGRSKRTIVRGGRIEYVGELADFAAYLEAVGR